MWGKVLRHFLLYHAASWAKTWLVPSNMHLRYIKHSCCKRTTECSMLAQFLQQYHWDRRQSKSRQLKTIHKMSMNAVSEDILLYPSAQSCHGLWIFFSVLLSLWNVCCNFLHTQCAHQILLTTCISFSTTMSQFPSTYRHTNHVRTAKLWMCWQTEDQHSSGGGNQVHPIWCNSSTTGSVWGKGQKHGFSCPDCSCNTVKWEHFCLTILQVRGSWASGYEGRERGV